LTILQSHNTDKNNIMITSATQNVLIITLLLLFYVEDKITVNTFTHFNLIQLSKQFSIRLIVIKVYKNGMISQALKYKYGRRK